eukprot:4078495-Amphidinium_carterae.1
MAAAATPRTPRTPGTPKTQGEPSSTTARDLRPVEHEAATPREVRQRVDEQGTEETRGQKRQPSVDEMTLRSSVERGEKRSAETELTRQQSEVSDVTVGGIVRKVNAGSLEYFTVDEEESALHTLPHLDVEQMIKKNAEEIEPDASTEKEDIHESKMAELDFFASIEAMEPVEDEEVDPSCKVDVTWVIEWRGVDGWRARCVARDFKFLSPERDDLFAATSSSNTSRIVDAYAIKYDLPTFTADVTKAYLQVPEEELVFVLAPPEYEEWCRRNNQPFKKWWRMKKMLYGRRPAATKWIKWASDIIKSCEFEQFVGAPYIFFNADRQCLVELHMDDFYGTGPLEAVEWFKSELEQKMKLKRFLIHDVPDGNHPEVRYSHLKRLRVRTESGMEIHPNSKHTAMLLHLLGMTECKGATSPMVSRSQEKAEEDDDEELDKDHSVLYRKCVGILLYLAQDRVDIQFSCRILSQFMSRPTVLAFRRLKRVARYLRGTVDYYIQIKKQDLRRDVIKVHCDADWAGDKTRRSVTAGVLYWDRVLMFAWSRFQTALALSSGESEYYQLTTAAGEASFMRQLMEFLGEMVTVELHTDSSAAMGMCRREGTSSRMRHVDLRMLWLQQHIKNKEAKLFKISGSNNTADVGTKALAAPVLNRHLETMGFRGSLLEESSMKSAMKVSGVRSQHNDKLRSEVKVSGVRSQYNDKLRSEVKVSGVRSQHNDKLRGDERVTGVRSQRDVMEINGVQIEQDEVMKSALQLMASLVNRQMCQ